MEYRSDSNSLQTMAEGCMIRCLLAQGDIEYLGFFGAIDPNPQSKKSLALTRFLDGTDQSVNPHS
jgi:hypothetical protein